MQAYLTVVTVVGRQNIWLNTLQSTETIHSRHVVTYVIISFNQLDQFAFFF